MKEKEFVELVNKEIDGTLADKERTKLKKYLERNTKAQQEYDDFLALARVLGRVEKATPPPHLKQQILNTVNLTKPAAVESRKSRPFLRQLLPNAQPLKYAYTFAFGVVAGMLLFLAFSVSDRTPKRIDDMRGTLLSEESARSLEAGEQITLREVDLEGTVSTRTSRDVGLVEVELNSRKEAQLLIHFEGDVAFQAFRQTGTGKHEIASISGEVRITTSGTSKFTFVFEKKQDDTQPLQLTITSENRTIYNAPLSLQSGTGSGH